MKKIIVLDTLIKQTSKQTSSPIIDDSISHSRLHPNITKRIYQEYSNLVNCERTGKQTIEKYLKNKNGKKIQGAENVFKYRLNKGDRLLYTWGRYLPYINEKDKDSLVLLGYSNHDKQGLYAKNKEFLRNKHDYKYATDIIKTLQDFNIKDITDSGIDIEDLYTIAEIILDNTYNKHIKYIIPDGEWAIDNVEELSVSLTKEQGDYIDNYLEHPSPTLIIGGGGSGKSLIAVHLFVNFNHSENTKNLYFTQSRELREKVKESYKVVERGELTKNTIPEVLDINYFCLDQLGKNSKNLATINDFLNFLNSDLSIKNELNSQNISIYDVWSEIRGTIKGSMQSRLTKDVVWQRTTFANQNNFGNINKLNNYIERQTNKQEFILKYSIEETIKKSDVDTNLTFTDKDILKKIIKYFTSFNPKIRMLDDNTYINKISEEESTLEKNNRNFLLKLCKKYNEYCRKNNLFDENDLVCMMFEKFGENGLPQYDRIIVDEVQDYTELQIYLIYKMCKNQSGIIFAGDSHQMINPTMFSIKRLKELFYDSKNKKQNLQVDFLSQNFRCTQGIINCANKLSDIRRNIIGKKEKEEEQPEFSMREGEFPIRLKYTEENLKLIITKIIQSARTVILVANNKMKDSLISLYGEEKYKSNKISKIFTVAEIKGMEYKYVVCFNLISEYIDIWNKLIKENVGKKKSKYRFYFNLIYVAMTRAQNHLCFIDELCCNELEDKLKFDYIEKYDEEKLHISDLTSSDSEWLKEAKSYEMEGKYEQAKEIYEKYFPDNKICIYRCKARIAENNKSYSDAVKYYLLIDNTEAIKNILAAIKEENDEIYRLCNAVINPQLIQYKNNYSNQELSYVINKYFRNEQESNIIKCTVIKVLNRYLNGIDYI